MLWSYNTGAGVHLRSVALYRWALVHPWARTDSNHHARQQQGARSSHVSKSEAQTQTQHRNPRGLSWSSPKETALRASFRLREYSTTLIACGRGGLDLFVASSVSLSVDRSLLVLYHIEGRAQHC